VKQPGPYFRPDRRLDPPDLPAPGCFTDLEVGILGPHFRDHLNGMVQLPGQGKKAMPDSVHVPGADLDWTVAPRVGLGYRLPSGFGEFVLDFRPLASQGFGSLPVTGGTTALSSHLDLNEIDLDYASREFLLLNWPYCYLKWRFGLRLDYFYYDALAEGPAGAAGGGGTTFAARETDSYVGVGPHYGLTFTRPLGCTGLSLVGQADSAINIGRIRQGFFEDGATKGGLPAVGETHVSSSQAVYMVNAQLGLGWQPPGYQNFRLFVGYEYEYWWNLGRLSTTPTSRGELSDQGVLLRAEYSF
jgi:hypothetical protein